VLNDCSTYYLFFMGFNVLNNIQDSNIRHYYNPLIVVFTLFFLTLAGNKIPNGVSSLNSNTLQYVYIQYMQSTFLFT
jgi:hypothetical protein